MKDGKCHARYIVRLSLSVSDREGTKDVRAKGGKGIEFTDSLLGVIGRGGKVSDVP